MRWQKGEAEDISENWKGERGNKGGKVLKRDSDR